MKNSIEGRAPSGVKPGAASGFLESGEKDHNLPKALRSRARHLSMLTLYTSEAHLFKPDRPLSEMLRWLCKDPPRRARSRALVEAALANLSEIDGLLNQAITDWTLDRLGAIERSALRVSAAEVFILRDAPAGAVINDAVELARRYGEETSPGFVNAVMTQFCELEIVSARLAMPPSGERNVDLHTHTLFSDGDLSPMQLVKAAADAGLCGLAIADHDEVGGIDLAIETGKELGVEIVPGVELTSYLEDAEFHILGLFIDHRNSGLASELDRFREGRRRRINEMTARLTDGGTPVDPRRVFELAGNGAVGRPHLARALVEAGHARDFQDAFKRLIGNHCKAYCPKVRITPAEAVNLIHDAGGLALLAHPGSTGKDELLPRILEAGIDGLEVLHALHSGPTAEHYQRWADRRDLSVCGGSDYHGSSLEVRPLGSPAVPETWMIRLRNTVKLRQEDYRPTGVSLPGTTSNRTADDPT